MMLLTKSKFMNGLQCPRLLWFANQKKLPEIALSDKHKFAQGHEFEVYVHKLFPDGIKLEESDFIGNINQTKELIEQRKTIFEAGLKFGDYYVRCDILKPNDDGSWDLIEIKSSSSVKPVHFPDLAFQKFVCEKLGLTISNCFVYFINKEFVKNGEINPAELVSFEDVTEQVNNVEDVEENAKMSLEVMKMSSFEDIPISQKCNKLYECPLKKDCWGTLPEYNVLQLTNWRVYWKLLAEGIEDIKDIPEGTKLSAKDEVILESLKKSPYVSKEHIKHFICSSNFILGSSSPSAKYSLCSTEPSSCSICKEY